MNNKIQVELAFWLRIMKEHAFFLELGLPSSRENLVRQAERFVLTFADLQVQAERNLSPQQLQELILEARTATSRLVNFKHEILNLLINCQLRLGLYPLLVNHITREAVMFLELLEEWEEEEFETELLEETIELEEFWSRIMTDHAKFIEHLLDPSQRSLIHTAHHFSERFDALYRQALDYHSMLEAEPLHFPALNSFTTELMEETQQIATFKRTGRDLLLNCQALATATPLLMDHVMREAEHFLGDLVVLKAKLEQENKPLLPPCNPLPPATPPFS